MKNLSNLLYYFQLHYSEMLKDLFKFTALKLVIRQYAWAPLESTANENHPKRNFFNGMSSKNTWHVIPRIDDI